MFGENAIYLCGFYGPDFYALSYDGVTLKRISDFYEDTSPTLSDFYGNAFEITLENADCVKVMLETDSDGSAPIYVNTKTFEYSDKLHE